MTDRSSRTNSLIINGVPWYDDRGEIVNAHGASLIEDGGRYYLFGEYQSDGEGNSFLGFSCYSSDDLVNWRFERIALPPQPDGLLGPDRRGERVKVMRCPSTGQYLMYMHTDDLGLNDPYIGLATSDTIAGEYEFRGALEYQGEPIRRWDMGTFADSDGTGYLLLHEGDIYRLSADYARAETQVAHEIAPGGESPAMFAQDGRYYLLLSNKTSWERNDNYYLTAPSIAGPWTHRGLFAAEGSLTHNSQCSFVFRLGSGEQDVPMYLGDRWSYPHHASAATYVWLPLRADGDRLTLGEFWPAWNPSTAEPVALTGREIAWAFSSAETGAQTAASFFGSKIIVLGRSDADSGYARIEVLTPDGESIHSQLIDFYSLVGDDGIRYVSPTLAEGDYSVRITVTGELPVWYDKSGRRFGSQGTKITVSKIIVLD